MSVPEHPLLRTVPGGTHVEIDGDALFLGRDCHLVSFIPALLNKVVSNRHCVVRREAENRWILEDLGSTNGTWIRGARLYGKTVLHTGDAFTLGRFGPGFECHRGFGGTGPNATISEYEMADGAVTVIDPPDRPAAPAAGPKTAPLRGAPAGAKDKPDGSAERPFRAGQAPTLTLRHEHTGQVYAVSGYTIVVGRDPAAQVVIRADDEKHVSGRHAEIQVLANGQVVVRDLGSRNGTWVNDQRVKDTHPLAVGDRLLLGAMPTILLVKRVEGAQPAAGA